MEYEKVLFDHLGHFRVTVKVLEQTARVLLTDYLAIDHVIEGLLVRTSCGVDDQINVLA